MTTKPKLIWNIEASNIVRQPNFYISRGIFGDRGYLFHIDVLEEQIPLFPASIKTFRVLIREQNKRKKTPEYRFSIDERYQGIEYTKEMILKETKRKIKGKNIEPLDYYK